MWPVSASPFSTYWAGRWRRIPDGGDVAFIDEIRLTVAGTAAGAAIDCAKLGLRVLAAGAVGEDEKGDFVLDVYRRHGIDCAAMRRIPGVPTSATILNVRPNGDRPALHVRGASDRMWVDEADLEAICQARFVHMGGSGLLARMDGEPTAALLAPGAGAGRGDHLRPDRARPRRHGDRRPLPAAYRLFHAEPGGGDGALGRCDGGGRRRLLPRPGRRGGVIVKCGAAGSLYAAPGVRLRTPAFAVEVVDTTGCGDAYCAGFIAALARGWDIERACRLGAAAGALVATGLGSDAGIRDFDGTAALLDGAPTLPLS